MSLRADDRVLLLDIPAERELTLMARVLSRGVLVGLGDTDAVDRARRALAEFHNVMFIGADLRKIPWRDQFFTVILVPEHMREAARAAQQELTRVLAPDGRMEGMGVEA